MISQYTSHTDLDQINNSRSNNGTHNTLATILTQYRLTVGWLTVGGCGWLVDVITCAYNCVSV